MMKRLLIAAIACVAVSTFAAMNLGEAKSAGIVGEQADGYVGLVKANASAEAESLVAEINSKRRARYEDIAKKNGIEVSAVEARAGQRAIEKTAPGNYIKAAGGWRKK